jgi:hypothetical protein
LEPSGIGWVAIMNFNLRYEADHDKNGEWFVFDNEACYCMAGPLKEDEAISLQIKLNKELSE